jgi:hypothetical protein
MTRAQVTVLVGVAAAVWAFALYVAGVPLSLDQLKPFSLVVTAVLLAFGVFNKWLWKWSIFRGWLVNKPVFGGTWRMQLRSNYVDPSSGSVMSPITVFYAVRETLIDTSIRLFSAQSSSALGGVQIKPTEDGLFELHATYLGVPKVQFRDKNQIHFGAVALALYGTPVNRLAGHYWTDIGSRGDIESDAHVSKVTDSYDAANAAFSATSSV